MRQLKIYSAIWLALLLFRVEAQNIIWERRIESLYDDELFSITAADSGNYFACGFGARYTTIRGIGTKGIALLKLNANGDTLWTKTVNHGYKAKILYSKRGSIYMVSHTATFPGQSELHFFELSGNGEVIQDRLVFLAGATQGTIIPNSIAFAPDSSIIVCGFIGSLRSSGNTQDMWVARIEPQSGLTYWINRYNDHPYTLGFHIEPTPRGTYLASGTAGSRIWAMEFDSNGTELRRQTFYQAPSRDIYKESAVQQAPDGRLIVSGYYGGSQNAFYLASHDGWSTRKFWGGEQGGYIPKPTILDDGSVAFNDLRRLQSFFTKIDKDSSLQWSTPLPYSSNFTGVRLKDLVFNQDSSTTAVGYYSDLRNSFAEDYFVARISGVGVPYDPTTPVATRPPLGSKGGISIWPQPASHANGGTLHFGGFAGPATLALYNMKGQQVLPVLGTAGTATTLLPRQPVPIGHLPAGLYVYRLIAKDRVWTGKVVIGE